MLFNSAAFAVFFPLVTLAYFLSPAALRGTLLLVASFAFYAWAIPAYALVLCGVILVDYTAGLLIAKSRGTRRRAWLIVSLAANIGLLAVFKYYDFANGNLAWLLSRFGWSNPLPVLSLVLPIGLSFHTFQSMAYVIEVWRGRQPPERNLGLYALYVMFYPQLVAGPIERPQNLLHQFRERHSFEPDRVASGLRLMAWGLFKKVVVADRLAVVVNAVYGQPHDYHGLPLIVATVAFAFQIYCDFSGYSDIAIGAARVMGFDLMRNFERPYLAASPAEFWRRWHISLSTWFRDYVYYPLGGNRVSASRWRFNIMVVFLLSGIWHGANWTFVVWGALNGLFVVVEAATQGFRNRLARRLGPGLSRCLGVSLTFGLICLAWVFFRASSVADAWHILTHLTDGLAGQLRSLPRHYFSLPGCGKTETAVMWGGLAALAIFEGARHQEDSLAALGRMPVWVRFPVYHALVWAVILFGSFGDSQFIYFQF